jgi:superfamily II DNA or RNA helicase
VVPDADVGTSLGTIVLRPHQVRAVRLIRAALAQVGGAVLADEPGLGKTFVALAVAERFERRIVAAPAAVRSTWRHAAARAGVPVEFVSLEALSRDATPPPAPFLIVDEAHRAATRTTRRYRRIAWLAHGARVLLLTATPVRNRTAELQALLALFLGPGATTADDALVARCVIRRSRNGESAAVPVTRAHRAWRPRGSDAVAPMLRALPPPLALPGTTDAGALVATTLARCWASSAAALERALVRRLHRGAAIAAMLDAGRIPDRAALAAWIVGDDAMQLAFPFVAERVAGQDLPGLRASLDRHIDGVGALLRALRPRVGPDAEWRSNRLRAVRRRHPDAVVVAFTGYEATASVLFGKLRREAGVVLLTGRGARSAVGPLAREFVLESLATGAAQRAAPARLAVRLVIATDLLAEGVNLQAASVIVHLDDPWTPAAIAQRVGRAARMGSAHAVVHVYRFAPSVATESLTQLPARHAAKVEAARRSLVPSHASEALRQAVAGWTGAAVSYREGVVAAARARTAGVLARVDHAGRSMLIHGRERGRHRWIWTDAPGRLITVVNAVIKQPAPPPGRHDIAAAARSAMRWAVATAARGTSGLTAPASRARHRAIARVSAWLDQQSPAEFPRAAARVAALRRRMAVVHGAGFEFALDDLLGCQTTDNSWLARLELLVHQAAPRAHPAVEPWPPPEVVALLFLRVADPTAQAVPAAWPAPPAACSETAVPR